MASKDKPLGQQHLYVATRPGEDPVAVVFDAVVNGNPDWRGPFGHIDKLHRSIRNHCRTLRVSLAEYRVEIHYVELNVENSHTLQVQKRATKSAA